MFDMSHHVKKISSHKLKGIVMVQYKLGTIIRLILITNQR